MHIETNIYQKMLHLYLKIVITSGTCLELLIGKRQLQNKSTILI